MKEEKERKSMKKLEDFGIHRVDKLIKISIKNRGKGCEYEVEFIGCGDSFDRIGALADALASTSVQYGVSSDVTIHTVKTALAIAQICHKKGE